ncbi:unnamed protein product [Caenorhabditis sp. 36 PRJEB53466]|nr:unnamed protein product [Caenorhabditis sp. 36 PRJEB53466]
MNINTPMSPSEEEIQVDNPVEEEEEDDNQLHEDDEMEEECAGCRAKDEMIVRQEAEINQLKMRLSQQVTRPPPPRLDARGLPPNFPYFPPRFHDRFFGNQSDQGRREESSSAQHAPVPHRPLIEQALEVFPYFPLLHASLVQQFYARQEAAAAPPAQQARNDPPRTPNPSPGPASPAADCDERAEMDYSTHNFYIPTTSTRQTPCPMEPQFKVPTLPSLLPAGFQFGECFQNRGGGPIRKDTIVRHPPPPPPQIEPEARQDPSPPSTDDLKAVTFEELKIMYMKSTNDNEELRGEMENLKRQLQASKIQVDMWQKKNGRKDARIRQQLGIIADLEKTLMEKAREKWDVLHGPQFQAMTTTNLPGPSSSS